MHPAITKSFAILSITVSGALGRDVPQNIRTLYHTIKENASCFNPLASGFWSSDGGDNCKQLELPPFMLRNFALTPSSLHILR
jgi:hypothetical protein